MALLEAEGSSCLPPAGCAWKAYFTRPAGSALVRPLPRPQKSFYAPHLTLSPVSTFSQKQVLKECRKLWAVASDIVSHLQLSKDENSWRILLIHFTLNNPPEHQLSQHWPNSRLVCSELTSLTRDMRPSHRTRTLGEGISVHAF